MASNAADGRKGFFAAVGAFLIWGLLPLYLKALHVVSPLEIMAQRLVWCCIFVLIWLALQRQLSSVLAALRNPGVRMRLSLSALLICCNWLLYVWSVNSGHVVETSLGYFINPLVNVLLGVCLLSERLNRWQWTAVACAASGVAWLSWVAGGLPWIALMLAFSFSAYGLIRKTVAVDALTGLGTETLLAAPLGFAYLLYLHVWPHAGAASQPELTMQIRILLILSGIVTALPLALFAFAARRLPYSTIGLIQYLGPSLQLLLGVLVYHEAFTSAQATGFGLIWFALAIYAADGLLRTRRVAVA